VETLLKIIYHNIEMLDTCPARPSMRPHNKNMDESFRARMISKLLNSPDYLGRNYNNKRDSTKYLKNKKICKIIDYLRYYDGKLINNNVNNPNRKTTSILDDFIYLDGKDAIILEDNPPSNLDGGHATTTDIHVLDLQYSDKSRKCDDNDDNSCENPYKSRKCDDNDDISCKSRKYDDNDDMSCKSSKYDDNDDIPCKSRKCHDNDHKPCKSRKRHDNDDKPCENPDSYVYLDGKDATMLQDRQTIKLDSGNANTCNTEIIDLQDSRKSRKYDDNDDKSCKYDDNDDKSCKSRKYDDNDDKSCKSRKYDDNDDKSCENPESYIYLDGKGATILQDTRTIKLDSGNANTCNTEIIDLQDSRKSRKCNDDRDKYCENQVGYVYLDGKNAIILEDSPPSKLDSGNATTCNTDIIDLQDSRKLPKCNDNVDISCENQDSYVYLDGKNACILEDSPPIKLDSGNATTCNTDMIDLQPLGKSSKYRDIVFKSCENQESYIYLDGKGATILEDNPPANLDCGNAITCNRDIIDLQSSDKSSKCRDIISKSSENPDRYIYLDGKGAIILEDNPPGNLDGGNATTCNTDVIDLQPSDKSNKSLDCESLQSKIECKAIDIPIINTVYNTAAKIKGVQVDSPYLDGGSAINYGVITIDLHYSQQSHANKR
jgi:hypothetical protein